MMAGGKPVIKLTMVDLLVPYGTESDEKKKTSSQIDDDIPLFSILRYPLPIRIKSMWI